jgi:hypothetical protein
MRTCNTTAWTPRDVSELRAYGAWGRPAFDVTMLDRVLG